MMPPSWWQRLRNLIAGRHSRREALAQIARNEQHYRAIIESQNDAVCRWKPDTTLTFANSHYCKLFGLDPTLTRGRRWIDFIPEPERATVTRVYEDLTRNPRNLTYEHSVCLADGRKRWILWIDVPLLDENGVCTEFQSVGRDITDRKLAEQALRESEERYRRIVDTAQEGIWMVDADFHTTFINQAMATMLGYAPAEMLGRPLMDFVHERGRAFALAGLAECRAGNRVRLDFLFRHKLGHECWAMVCTSPIHDGDDGQPLQGTLALVTDITERKRMEANLLERESLFRTVFESSSLGIALINLDGSTRRVNQALASMLGYSISELEEKSVASVTHPEDRAGDTELFQRMMQGELPHYSLEKRLIRSDGSLVWVLIHCSLTGGPAPLAVGLVEDITERRRHREELAAVNRDLESRVNQRTSQLAVQAQAMDSTMEGMSVLKDGYHLYVNKSYAELFGYTPESLQGQAWSLLFSREEQQRLVAEAYPALERDGRWRGEVSGLRRQGGAFSIEMSMVQARDGHVVCSCRDITLALAAREMLNQRSQMLERATRAKDEFLAAMSHELRTPLAGVLMTSESLRQGTYGALTGRQNQMLQHIEESGRHLLDLLNDILNLSKIEAGKMEVIWEPIPVQTACESVVRMVKPVATEKNLELSIDVSPPELMVDADARLLTQMLLNLMTNAVKFTGPNGKAGLRAHASADGQQIEFQVWDTGIGIEPRFFQRLFKPFTQVDAGLSRKYGGSGLGLALVLRMAELHGGGISVESEPGKGSQFTLRLPAPSQPSRPVIPAKTKTTQAKVSADGHKPHLLVVDDNPVTLAVISDVLQHRGYTVQRARSGPEALELVLERTPALILLDIQMPGMDGFEVARALRGPSRKATQRTPIVAITALTMPGDRERCLIAGMNDYLPKPIRLEELLDMVQRHCPTDPAASAASGSP